MKALETTAGTVAVLLGLGVGLTAPRVTATPLVLSAGTALVAWVSGSLVGFGLWLRRPAPDASVLAVKWSGSQLLIGAAAVLLLALLVHGMFSLLSMLHPALGAWRYLIIGIAASLVGCYGYATGAGFGEPVR
jgi:hypothetical protein